MDNIINLYQRKSWKTIFVTKSKKIEKKKKKETLGKRKTGVLKRVLIRDPIDLHFVLSNIKQKVLGFLNIMT